MKSTQPIIETMSDDELEAWFADAGIVGRVVDRCPLRICVHCAITQPDLSRAA